jgi:protein-tyrosine-phosphatase
MTTSRVAIAAVLMSLCVTPVSRAKVYVHWTQRAIPAVKTLGADDLVLDWNDDAKTMVEAATKRGYHVYFETTLEQAVATADSAARVAAAGIIVKTETSKTAEAEAVAQKLKVAHPKLKILVLNSGGRPPDMRGWLVFNKNGILQVSSPTSQPWLDSNFALVRYEQAIQKTQPPLYTFAWDLSDPLMKEQGPHPEDYALAIAEAGALHADLVLEIHGKQEKGLAEGDKNVLADWELVRRTLAFYQRNDTTTAEPAARVAVLTDDYDSSYETLNLMARHNIPYRVLHSSEVTAQDLAAFDVVIAFAELSKELSEGLSTFANSGGVAVLVNLKGPYLWESSADAKTNGPSVTYTIGKGRIIALAEPVADPETFVQDVRRLMVKDRIPVSLWNSLTTLVVAYPQKQSGDVIVELVNYAQESLQVQVQVKGKFTSVKYDTPERSNREMLKPSFVDGFTEFVVPGVVIGGRVQLAAAETSAR